MGNIQPERYNEYGEIIPQLPKPAIYERRMTAYDSHRIHQTKDLFDGDCSYCVAEAKKWQDKHQSWWGEDE